MVQWVELVAELHLTVVGGFEILAWRREPKVRDDLDPAKPV